MTRIKGITIWEQYVEYGVLGLVCVLFVAFTAMQFIGNQNAVTIAGKGEVRPGEVDRLVEDEAVRLNAMLQPDAAPIFVLDPPESIAPDFLARLNASIIPESARPIELAFVPMTVSERIPPGVVFNEPTIPPPASVVSRQYFDALSDQAIESYPELRERFDGPPYDKTWTTVAATFHAGDVLRQFRAGGPNDDPAPIPTLWHNDRVNIVNVVVEREEFAGGQWSNRTVVEPIPGQLHLRGQLAGDIDSSGRDMILRMLRDEQSQRALIQPPFLPTRTDAWHPPDPAADDLEQAADDEQRFRLLLSQLSRAMSQRAVAQRELDEMGESGGRGPEPPTPPGGRDRPPPSGGQQPPRRPPGGGAPPGGGPDVGGPGPGQTGPDRDERTRESLRRNLEQRIRQFDRVIERVTREIREIRPDFDADEVEPDPLDMDELTIWAHDLDVTAGKTYRYRIAVEIYNPFFARALNLVSEQEHLASEFQIHSGFSEWSDPIIVRPPVHVFVTRAYAPGQDRGGIGGRVFGEASVEVYRFHDGRWWESRFTVEPGQRIGTVREEGPRGEPGQRIDYGTEWFVLDILPDLDADSRNIEAGRGAIVVLQHLQSGETLEMRHPLQDSASELRQRLRSESQITMRDTPRE